MTFWSPENVAARQAAQAEQAQQQAAAEQAAQQQEFLSSVGGTLTNIVSSYAARNQRADTAQVARDFFQAFPSAGPTDFRQSVDALKAAGVLYEVKGPEGFMGQRSTYLHVL